MNSLRCIGLSLLVFLSACDAEKSPAPPPKVVTAAPVVDAPPAPVASAPAIAASSPAPEKPVSPVHELSPNVAAVKVVTATNPDSASKSAVVLKAASSEKRPASGNAKSAKVKADNAEVARRAPIASKTKTPSRVVKETRLSSPRLDLSLPPDMVRQLTPPSQVITAAGRGKSATTGAKPLLPKMFQSEDKDADFRLQGRLLSNEMQLQLRNESRREVEGAAVDFTFKQ